MKGKNITKKEIEQIEGLLSKGVSVKDITEIFSLSVKSVKRIRDGEHALQQEAIKSKEQSRKKQADRAVIEKFNDAIDLLYKACEALGECRTFIER